MVRHEALRSSPVADAVRPRLHEMLASAPRWTGGKQRLTSIRLHQLLAAEGYVASPRLVRREMAEWKRQRQEVYVPLVYRPGELAEVDFFEVLVEVAGQRQKAWMFLLRLMYSGRDFAWLNPRQDQVCFLDGHVRAFAHLGAVPHRVLYDNLKPAVKRVLVGAERELSARFLALATHYVLEASFARPGPGTTRVVSKPEARACAGNTSCQSQLGLISRPSVDSRWAGSMLPASSDIPATTVVPSRTVSRRSGPRCCRCPCSHSPQPPSRPPCRGEPW